MHTQSLTEVVDLYCALNSAVTSSGTRRLYMFAVRSYEKYLQRPGTLADLDDVTFAKFRDWRAAQVKHDTLRGECCKLLALWRWCASGKRRWIEEPEVTAPPQVYSPPKALTEEQLARLWKAAAAYRYRIGTAPGNLYLVALLYVLWDTSERIGAVHQIQWQDVDLRQLWLTVPASVRKGGRQGRAYKIRSATGDALERLRGACDGPTVFGGADLRTIWHCFGHLRIAADLPAFARPHTIRKSHASYLTAMGGDARMSLGHASDATTNNSYIDPTIASRGRQPADILFDPGLARRKWWRWWANSQGDESPR